MTEARLMYGSQGGSILYGWGSFLYGGGSRRPEIPSLMKHNIIIKQEKKCQRH